MRLVPKVFFFALVSFLISFLPLDMLCSQKPIYAQSFEFSPNELGRDELMRWTAVGRLVLSEVEGPGTTALRLVEQQVVKAIIDDFLVNDDTVGGCDQNNPAVARDYYGDFVVVWEDTRKGNPDIFAQRYNYEGTPIGSNFEVSDGGVFAPRTTPSIAMDDSGNFVITWADYRNGNSDIYAQRFDSAGIPQGINFKVNDDVGTAYRGSPSIAIGGYGRFVITWMDSRDDNYDIYAQIYDSHGNPQGSNFKVNDDVGTFTQNFPAVAMDDNANFVITWIDYRNGNYDIYAQMYNPQGSPSGSNFKVNDDALTSSQYNPVVAKDGSGNFVIAWEDYRGGQYIYAQRYGSNGTPLDSNFKVNDDVGHGHFSPAVTADYPGNFVITWMDNRNGNYDIYAQRYNVSGNPLGANFKVNDDAGTLDQRYPAIGVDGMGNFVITWQDFRDIISDIYAQRYQSAGVPLGSNFKVNDDDQTATQVSPAIAKDGSGKFAIVWEDHRYDLGDAYLQRYSASGTPLGSNLKVNDDGGITTQAQPAVAMNNSGNSVVTWNDLRNNNYDIYAQIYDPSGNPGGANLKVNDDAGTFSQVSPAIAMDGSGNFVICWQDYRNGNYDVYARMYQFNGSPLGSNFKVNDDVGTTHQYSPAIAMDNSGSFLITWQDLRNGNYDIYAQRYDYSGVPLGSNFKVNDDLDTLYQFSPAIAMDEIGNFVICWHDYRNGNYDIYAQRYDFSGIPLGSNFKVNDDTETAGQVLPAIAMEGSGRFVIAWRDDRNTNKYDVYAQRYDPSGNPLDSNYLVPNPVYASFVQTSPAVAASASKIFFTWMDTRRAKGYDIYAKVTDWLWPRICGDVNGDGVINVTDVVYLINYLFLVPPGPAPQPWAAGDVNLDGVVSITDVVYLINFLFLVPPGPPPCSS